MKLARLVDPNFHAAMDKLVVQDLPVRIAFRLKGVLKTTREEYAKYQEVHQAALEKYGRKGEDGVLLVGSKGEVQFDQDQYMLFAKEISDLTNEEVTVPTVGVNELGEKCTMTILEMDALDGVIVD